MGNSKSITIKSYNDTAYDYYRVVKSFELLPEIEIFADKVNKSGKILDLGCGPGHHAKYFSNLGFDIIGIDLSSKMIEIAKKESPASSFKVMDIQKMNFEKDSFDGVWASASLLHIAKNELPSVLIKIKEILQNDGLLYISLKYGAGSNFLADNRYGGVDKFYVYYQADEVEGILSEVGFEILDIKLKGKRTGYDTNSWLHIFCRNIK